nr:MAG: hypothetical protein DIU70_11425 [Bacillota bacterium]
MADRGVIRPQGDGTYVPDPAAAPLLAACLLPEVAVTATFTGPGEPPALRRFQIAGETALEVRVRWPEDPTCELVPLAGADAVVRELAAFFRLSGESAEPPAPSGPVPDGSERVPAPRLEEARDLAQAAGSDAARNLLEGAGVSTGVAGALAAALARPEGNGALVGFYRGEAGWTVRGFGFLAGAGGHWLLRPFARAGTEWVEVLPATPAQVVAAVTELVTSAVAEGDMALAGQGPGTGIPVGPWNGGAP